VLVYHGSPNDWTDNNRLTMPKQKWTSYEYQRFLQRKLNLATVPGSGNPIVQEHQDDCPRAVDNRPKETGGNGADNNRFRVSITLCYSSLRDSDPDGAATTLLDCLISAIGRFSQVDKRTLRKMAASAKRQGRSPGKD
jgi:hypothetical protein